MGKLSWRKHSSESALFLIPAYNIYKNVGNVILREYIYIIPSYRILKAKNVMHRKGGKQKLSNMKSLVKQAIRATGMPKEGDGSISGCCLCG